MSFSRTDKATFLSHFQVTLLSSIHHLASLKSWNDDDVKTLGPSKSNFQVITLWMLCQLKRFPNPGLDEDNPHGMTFSSVHPTTKPVPNSN